MKLTRISRALPPGIGLITAVALLCFAVGCATPIGVSYVDRRVAYHSLMTNVLSTERISSFSARELINFNLYQEFEDNPQKALADLHSGLAAQGDEDRIFALAELSFLHALNSGERSYYLAAAVSRAFPECPVPGNCSNDPAKMRSALDQSQKHLGQMKEHMAMCGNMMDMMEKMQGMGGMGGMKKGESK